MKKLIVTIICVLFASTSFAQIVGASSIAKQSTPKTTLGVKKHEFSIHGGIGLEQKLKSALSGIVKYKFKLSEKSDIRLLTETGILGSTDECSKVLPVIPIFVGVDYEIRFNNNWSIFADLGAGITIPLEDYIDTWDSETFGECLGEYYYRHSLDWCDDFGIGFAFTPEIGFSYKKLMFSFKYLYSYNLCRYNSVVEYDWDCDRFYEDYNYYDYSDSYDSHYFLFTLGYRF